MNTPALSFFEHGAAQLDEFARTGLLCAFDFDGTLAPIVTQPEQARTPLPVLQRLQELQTLAPIAVITGRAVADIREKLGFTPDYLIGNHGQEGTPGMEAHAAAHAALCREWKAALEPMLSDDSRFDPNIWIEDKTYSLSLHYRLARDQHAAEARLRDVLETLQPAARLVAGKCVFNVLPQDAMDKGHALQALIQASGARRALYLGDDVTDEDVFRLAHPDILGIRIGPSEETAARYYLNRRLDIVLLLDRLLRGLREADARNWIAACVGGQEAR